MDSNKAYCSWYQGDDQDYTGVAKDAFLAAKQHFEQSILTDEEKLLLTGASCVEDVQKAVKYSLVKYETKSGTTKTRKWLQKASEMVLHYSTVLDVFVGHHPEYVSLVWGTMKLLFIGVVNHGETLKLLAKSISQIASSLPQFKLVSILYPTAQMRLAVEKLYTCLLEFLVRAHGWCNESKMRHFYHSYTQPRELRYKDLLDRVTQHSNDIIQLATIGAQVELRIMHRTQDIQNKKLDLILSTLEASGLKMNGFIAGAEAFQSLQTSAQLDTNQRLSDLQFSQVLSSFSHVFEDPDNCYKHHLLFRNRRASGIGFNTSTNQFWKSPKLAKWSSCNESAITIVKGTVTARSTMQDFSVNVIESLRKSDIPVIWVLKNINKSKSGSISSTTDLMKYITFQALRLSGAITTEKQIAHRYSQFHTARTSKEWLDLFKKVIEHLGGHLYLVVDLATVKASIEHVQASTFILELSQMLQAAIISGMTTKVKVIFLVYETEWFSLLPSEVSDSIVPVKVMRQAPKQRQRNDMRRSMSIRVSSNARGRVRRM